MILKLEIEKDIEANEPHDKPVLQILADSMQDLPPEDIASIPTDGASQVDHYIYGYPKRNP